MAELHTCVAAGRLKGPDYVAVTTQVYRKAVDAAWEALTADSSSGDGSSSSSSSRSSEDVGRLMLKDSEWRDLQQVGRVAISMGRLGTADCRSCRAQYHYKRTNIRLLPWCSPAAGVCQGAGWGAWRADAGLLGGQPPPATRAGPQPSPPRQLSGHCAAGEGWWPPARCGLLLTWCGCAALVCIALFSACLLPACCLLLRCACGFPWPLQVTRGGVVLRLEQPLRRGDGIVFDRGDPQHQEQGGQVYDVLDASGSSLDSGAEGA